MPKLLEQVRTVISLRHHSLRTEQSYVNWIKQYIVFSRKRHPAELGAAEVTTFLSLPGRKPQRPSFNAESGAGGNPVPLSVRSQTGIALARRR